MIILGNIQKETDIANNDESEEMKEEIRKLKEDLQGINIQINSNKLTFQNETQKLDKLNKEKIDYLKNQEKIKEINDKFHKEFTKNKEEFDAEISMWEKKLNDISEESESKLDNPIEKPPSNPFHPKNSSGNNPFSLKRKS